ncbi:MAG: hypothetical protein ACHREM_14290 [Polyangiales bacterium]
MKQHTLTVALFSCLIAASSTARANPRPLPFTYIHESLPEGETEIEQYVDYVPMRVQSSLTGATHWYGATQFQTEFEHGITDRLELGLYVTYAPTPSEALQQSIDLTEGTGFKERLRFKLADTGAWPIDVALYGEVTESQNEIELEGKVILQRRIGHLRVAANAWVEREYYFDGRTNWVLNPTIGLTYDGSASVQPGIEYWMRAEYPDGGPSTGANHYLGPAVLLQLGRLWWSSGVYYRLNDASRRDDPGTGMAHVWVRSVIGFGL